VDVGRDVIDHRIVDLDGHDVGRVDDVWIYVAEGAAVVSPIVTGTGALLRQLGAVGDRITRLAPHVGFRHADRWREIVWDDVHALQRAQVVLEPRLHDLAGRPEGHRPRPGVELLYTDLIRLPVRDPSGRRIGVVDVRTTLPDPEPAVLGLLVAAHPLRRTLGLKRFDSTSQRFGGTRHHTRYLAWTADIQIRDGAILCPVPFTDLPLLSAAPSSAPPPMPDQPDAP
jgi:sporulation protein YlmC with PRC-barrel domain